MAAIFDALPGLPAPVGSISKSLASMWEDTAAHGKAAPSSDDSKATQVNFVLHLGFNTTPADAVTQFQTAVKFSRRYPSRVVVLCPQSEESGDGSPEIRAKVYGECTLGKSKGDTRCCEFVILGYPPSARQYLENQVSLCLSTDLPLYYWAHRFSASVKLADYRYLLTKANRVLLDSSLPPADALTYPWPNPKAVRDLVYARLLPVRQALGQFLSRYSMNVLRGGLKEVVLIHGRNCGPEARSLLGWTRDRMEPVDGGESSGGGKSAESGTSAVVYTTAGGGAASELALTFNYGNKKTFSWTAHLKRGDSLFVADFGTGRSRLAAPVSLLSPESALSEAMFF